MLLAPLILDDALPAPLVAGWLQQGVSSPFNLGTLGPKSEGKHMKKILLGALPVPLVANSLQRRQPDQTFTAMLTGGQGVIDDGGQVQQRQHGTIGDQVQRGFDNDGIIGDEIIGHDGRTQKLERHPRFALLMGLVTAMIDMAAAAFGPTDDTDTHRQMTEVPA
jgi:hypothetical protein